MTLVLDVLAGLLIIATVLPLIRHTAWWIRVFDFPRVQILLIGVGILGLYLLGGFPEELWRRALFALVAAATLYQALRVLPYTRLWQKQVETSAAGDEDPDVISFLVANVLMTNREFAGLVDLVREHRPDVFLAVETDEWWAERLRRLEDEYPHAIEYPLENTYGIVLRSRIPLDESAVLFHVQDDVPSIRAELRLASGRRIVLHGVHPRPPAPDESTSTAPRDAELLIVGREVRKQDVPTVVMGDLNDVAWSYTTRLFQRISKLLDPRRGRGMYATYNAQNPFFRWPLDHLFHSRHFRLVTLRRLRGWGSDHFPVLVTLEFDQQAVQDQDVEEATAVDKREALERIDEAL